MKIFPQIKVNIINNKYKVFFKKLPRNLEKNSFSAILILFLISLLFGAWVFYKYAFLVKKAEPQIQEGFLRIEEQAYQKIISQLDEQEKKFRGASLKEYSDPFRID